MVAAGGDSSQRIVSEYLAERVPDYRYRICDWFPATPVPGDQAAAKGEFAQRVTLVLYGPSGAKELAATYRIENGRVTGAAGADRIGIRRGLFNGRGIL